MALTDSQKKEWQRKNRIVRTSLYLPEVLRDRMAHYCASRNPPVKRNAVILRAIATFLAERGY